MLLLLLKIHWGGDKFVVLLKGTRGKSIVPTRIFGHHKKDPKHKKDTPYALC
jgi:hypothetical protein